MTTMVAELYDALKEAGASEEKARAASKAIADHEGRFARIDADLMLLKWMVGAILAGIVSLILKSFFLS